MPHGASLSGPPGPRAGPTGGPWPACDAGPPSAAGANLASAAKRAQAQSLGHAGGVASVLSDSLLSSSCQSGTCKAALGSTSLSVTPAYHWHW